MMQKGGEWFWGKNSALRGVLQLLEVSGCGVHVLVATPAAVHHDFAAILHVKYQFL